jgi:hypothetical protein
MLVVRRNFAGPPQTPTNFTLVSSTDTSIVVEWIPGYNGGHEKICDTQTDGHWKNWMSPTPSSMDIKSVRKQNTDTLDGIPFLTDGTVDILCISVTLLLTWTNF